MLSSFLLVVAAAGTLAAPAQSAGRFSVEMENSQKPRHILYEAHHIAQRYQPGYNEEHETAWKKILNPKLAVRQGTGTVIATPGPDDSADQQYVAPVQIGTPAQTINLDFDTGSSDLWVFSTDTNPDEVNGQTLYNPGKSSTAKKQDGETWKIGYADQSGSSGVVYDDVVSIGGLSVPNQAVESAQEVSAQFSKDNFSNGLLGLGYDAGNTIKPTKQKTWFSNIGPKLAKNLFTVRLRHAAKGSYDFGYIDSSKYTGDIVYTGAFADAQGHRLFNATVGGKPINAIADTGTSIAVIPLSAATAYWRQVRGAQRVDQQGQHLWLYSCSTKLPDYSITVGSNKVTIPGIFIRYAQNGEGSPYCVGGIGSIDGYDSLAILGDVFLKPNFVVFDDANSRIGFAKGA